MVQWLGLLTLTAKSPGSIPDQGTIPHAARHGPKKPQSKKQPKFQSSSTWLAFIFLSTSSITLYPILDDHKQLIMLSLVDYLSPCSSIMDAF